MKDWRRLSLTEIKISGMNLLKILTYPDSFLTRTAKPVGKIDQSVQEIIDKMTVTMYESQGVGLAAVQVGIDMRIIICDVSQVNGEKNPQVFINPEIVSSSGETVSENEGCLSVPDFRADVKRAASVFVAGLNQKGESLEIEADGLLSMALQHEIDHLNGLLFIDRISCLKRNFYKKKIAKQLKRKKNQ